MSGTLGLGDPIYWIQLTGPVKYPVDLGLRGRSAAAFARQRIVSFAIARYLFDGLDVLGKDALCFAWAQFVSIAIAEQDILDPTRRRRSAAYAQVDADAVLVLRILHKDRLARLEDSMTNILFFAGYELHRMGSRTTDLVANLEAQLAVLQVEAALSEKEKSAATALHDHLNGR